MQKNSHIIRLFLWYIYPAAIYYDNLNLDIVCWSFRVIAKIPFGIVSVFLKKAIKKCNIGTKVDNNLLSFN